MGLYPLVMINIAMDNGPFIEGLSIKNGDYFQCFVFDGMVGRERTSFYKHTIAVKQYIRICV